MKRWCSGIGSEAGRPRVAGSVSATWLTASGVRSPYCVYSLTHSTGWSISWSSSSETEPITNRPKPPRRRTPITTMDGSSSAATSFISSTVDRPRAYWRNSAVTPEASNRACTPRCCSSVTRDLVRCSPPGPALTTTTRSPVERAMSRAVSRAASAAFEGA